ncbi:MAG: type II toxin-antitoxin system RelE/ParE family toxin [bacterium]|nr:type II toxin-antitoxin system RelE/ParE family toxin [bacterium]
MAIVYKFQFSEQGENDFAALPKKLQKLIFKKLNYFEKSQNPLTFAKKLQGLSNKFCFRIGDYRIIVSQKNQNLLIILVILKIAHRSKIYEDV